MFKKNKTERQPNRKIKAVVDMIFDDIPYSEEVVEAQSKIEAALNTEFDKIKEGKHEDEALEELLGEYGRLSKMAELAGYPAECADKWRKEGEAVDIRPLKKEILRQRIRVYLTSLFAVFALLQIFWFAVRIFVSPSSAVTNLIIAAIDLAIAYIPFRKYLKIEKAAEGAKYDTDSYKYLRVRSDRYSKRLLNSIALLFGVIFIWGAYELIFLFLGSSKLSEFAENAFQNSIAIEIPVFILLKNYLCCRIFKRRIKLPDKTKYKKHVTGITIFSAAYWLGVCLFTLIMRNSVAYPANLFTTAGFLFALLILIYNLTLRKRFTYQNIVVNKPRIAVVTSVTIALSGFYAMQRDTWYTQSYINSVPVVEHNVHKIEYDDDTGVYTITKSTDDFKILHLTDIHIGGSLFSYSKDLKALKACYAEIEHTHPDLVIVTGDMCFPMGIMSLSLNNSAPVQQFAAFMRNTGIPWAFTYGNHDTESMSTLNKTELNEVYKSLSYKTSANLLYPYVQPDIKGRNNQLIEVRNADGSLNTGLFLIDSNSYTGEGLNVYDYIHDDQVDWYAGEVNRMNEEAGHTVNSMAFFHIPLQEYKTATELYLDGSDEVTYYFGENPGDHGGITNDLVCCSDYPSKLFDTAVELGSTTAMFCGHDHYNNASIEYKGIRLTYGMSIDYLAQPGISKETKQRGAELITIHSDSSWDLEQIPLNSIT
ncbi:metallophosphoesterase [Ruminococcus sp.]|uniref:metallophosphoesterase n=1 Tax=Ruminococcus sp. TaxID=41978 RepID=UPI0025E3AC60|nr:metallophosphoesterase [Ruminococcus sp.]